MVAWLRPTATTARPWWLEWLRPTATTTGVHASIGRCSTKVPPVARFPCTMPRRCGNRHCPVAPSALAVSDSVPWTPQFNSDIVTIHSQPEPPPPNRVPPGALEYRRIWLPLPVICCIDGIMF